MGEQWEHLFIQAKDANVQTKMDEHSIGGWELVSVVGEQRSGFSVGFSLFFKRRSQSRADTVKGE